MNQSLTIVTTTARPLNSGRALISVTRLVSMMMYDDAFKLLVLSVVVFFGRQDLVFNTPYKIDLLTPE